MTGPKHPANRPILAWTSREPFWRSAWFGVAIVWLAVVLAVAFGVGALRS